MAATPPLIVPRWFVRTHAAQGAANEPQPLDAFLQEPAIVLLGDPGSGKTTCFEEAARREPGEYLTVGQFLADPVELHTGSALYLDALDEKRSRTRDGVTTIEEVAGRLRKLGRPAFRLSCREADWLHEIDQQELARASASEALCVLRIQPLDEENIEAIAQAAGRNGHMFREDAARHGISEWLGNPWNLRLLIEVVQQRGWPDSKEELFRTASESFVLETNPIHARIAQPPSDANSLLEAAGYASAALLLSRSIGLALSDPTRGPEVPSIADLERYAGNPERDQRLLARVARSRLFTGAGAERVQPMHRTMAEYLAARFLAGRIRNGFPIGRALALLCASDGRPPTELRGVYAWLTTLLPEQSQILIALDPIALILYGDPAQLPHAQRVTLLGALEELEGAHPWYRSEARQPEPFGALGQPDMEPAFRQILTDPAKPPLLQASVLDALTHGSPMPGLREALMAVVRDSDREDFLRFRALEAYSHACQGDTGSLVSLLEDIHSRVVTDPHHDLRGQLLKWLYPGVIGPHDVVPYIVPEEASHVGSYHMVVEFFLFENTPEDELPGLLDALARVAPFPTVHGYSRTARRLVGKATAAGLHAFGTELVAERIYRWLGATVDNNGHPAVDQDDAVLIAAWFEGNPGKYFDLLEHWLEQLQEADNPNWEFMKFQRRLHLLAQPDNFMDWAIERASREPDDKKAEFLFEQAAWHLYRRESPDPARLQQLHDLAEARPPYQRVMQRMSSWPISDWQREDAQERVIQQRDSEEARAAQVAEFTQIIDGIREGQQIGALNHLARVYYGLFIDVDDSQPPVQRLIQTVGATVTAAALQGFKAALRNQVARTPREIGESEAQGQQYQFGFAVLAGLDEISQSRPETTPPIPNEMLRSAVAFSYANVVQPNDDHPWFDELIKARPDLAAEALLEYWHPQLAASMDSVHGLHDLANNPTMAHIGPRIAMSLLREFPRCNPVSLRYLLYGVLKDQDDEELLQLSHEVLADHDDEPSQQEALWHAVAFLLAPDRWRAIMFRFAGASGGRAGTILHFLVSDPFGRRQHGLQLSRQHTSTLLELCGALFPPVELPISGRVTPAYETAEKVQALINRLSNDSTVVATHTLERLRATPSLVPWHASLAHALALQLRRRRDSEYRPPVIAQVVVALNHGAPVDVRDLQALVVEILHDLERELRHGPTDGWKGFWNVDSHARAENPRVEDDCRDRILERIRSMLARIGVTAEPEGHYAEDNRSDIKCVAPGFNLPIEIKRHYHADLWSAARCQLHERYARDPGAEEHGIYLVLWFGSDWCATPRPPAGIERPQTAEELGSALLRTLPSDLVSLIRIVVFDVSRPPN